MNVFRWIILLYQQGQPLPALKQTQKNKGSVCDTCLQKSYSTALQYMSGQIDKKRLLNDADGIGEIL